MKVLLLFIYSDWEFYRKMLEVQKKYIHDFEEVDSYFIQMRENQNLELIIEDDKIFVKGKEIYMNIIFKTIKAIEFLFPQKKYDFLVRSNISTIVNIPTLLSNLEKIPQEKIYTGCQHFNNLQWLDHRGGISDEKLFGTSFMGGISIILSSDLVNLMLEKKDQIRYDIVDDVAIGIFFNQFCKDAIENGKKYILRVHYTTNNITEFENDDNLSSIDFFRNNNGDRNNDINNMTTLCQLLYNK
jgi:hypothetical protein